MHGAEQKYFVLKEVPKEHFQDITKLYHDLPRSPFLRTVEDIIEECSMLVYSYCTTNLLELRTQQGIPPRVKKEIPERFAHSNSSIASRRFCLHRYKCRAVCVV